MASLLLVACALVFAAPAHGVAGSPEFPAEMRDTAALMLRLADVGGGYTLGDDTGCGTYTENAPPELGRAIVTHLPEMCSIQFEHLRRSPYIESFALGFRGPDGPAAFFALRKQLLAYETSIERLTEQPQAGVGEEARLLVTDHAFVPGSERDRPGAIVVWRRGTTLGMVLVAGPRQSRAAQMAQRLALRQDQRILAPTALGPGDNDDLEVPLADPRVGVPVRWLGRRFAPRRGLPSLRLSYTYGPERRDEGLPRPRARLEYDAASPRRQGVSLELWRPAQWRRISRSFSGAHPVKSRCARERRIAIRGGRAVMYAGYGRSPRSGRCPARSPDLFAALAFLPRVTIAINMPSCDRCAEGGASSGYNSWKGLSAAVRALRRYRAPQTP